MFSFLVALFVVTIAKNAVFSVQISGSIVSLFYDTHNNKWNFQVVRASLNLCARVARNSIKYCEYYSLRYMPPKGAITSIKSSKFIEPSLN